MPVSRQHHVTLYLTQQSLMLLALDKSEIDKVQRVLAMTTRPISGLELGRRVVIVATIATRTFIADASNLPHDAPGRHVWPF